MTTAHRPTWVTARGAASAKDTGLTTRAIRQEHTVLKERQFGQGRSEELAAEDLKAKLLESEREHQQKRKREGREVKYDEEEEVDHKAIKLVPDDIAALDADDKDSSDEDESDDDDSDDDTAALLRELENIKRERAEEQERREDEKRQEEERIRTENLMMGNPLLQGAADFSVKKRWDDDVVFKNCARGVAEKKEATYINDTIRSDFHRKFMKKYVQ